MAELSHSGAPNSADHLRALSRALSSGVRTCLTKMESRIFSSTLQQGRGGRALALGEQFPRQSLSFLPG